MLFDLKGKRRRTVQVTYVALAFLMAVGLIGAGVGSGVSGGIFDLFSGGGGSSTANSTIEKKIKRAEKALRANPKDEAAMVSLVRSHYSLATTDTDQRTGKFGKEGKKELGKASAAWKRYLAAEPKKPDASLAGVMVLAYGKDGLNQPPNAAEAAEIVATVHDDAPSWLALATYAKAAGQDRKAELAGKKAIEKAPKAQKDDYKKQVKGLLSGAGEQTVQPSGG